MKDDRQVPVAERTLKKIAENFTHHEVFGKQIVKCVVKLSSQHLTMWASHSLGWNTLGERNHFPQKKWSHFSPFRVCRSKVLLARRTSEPGVVPRQRHPSCNPVFPSLSGRGVSKVLLTWRALRVLSAEDPCGQENGKRAIWVRKEVLRKLPNLPCKRAVYLQEQPASSVSVPGF